MEKQTRINKYKDLRESLKEEVTIDPSVIKQEEVNDDEFLAFLPKKEEVNLEDTLSQPLSYETLEENEDIHSAINQAKVNVGKEQYNTRLDILNRIKSENNSEFVEEKKHSLNQGSLMDKLAAMSPEEDVVAYKEFEANQSTQTKEYQEPIQPIVQPVEEPTLKMNVSGEKLKGAKVKKQKVKKVKQRPVKVVDEDQDEEESTIVTKVLNGIIIALILVFVVLCVFIVKELFL